MKDLVNDFAQKSKNTPMQFFLFKNVYKKATEQFSYQL